MPPMAMLPTGSQRKPTRPTATAVFLNAFFVSLIRFGLPEALFKSNHGNGVQDFELNRRKFFLARTYIFKTFLNSIQPFVIEIARNWQNLILSKYHDWEISFTNEKSFAQYVCTSSVSYLERDTNSRPIACDGSFRRWNVHCSVGFGALLRK